MKNCRLWLILLSLSSFSAYGTMFKSIILESALFENDHIDVTDDYQLATVINLGRDFEFKESLHGVVDIKKRFTVQHERNFINIRNLYLEFELDEENWSFLAGVKTYRWSQLEFFHPIDVLNSQNYDSNFETFERIGEPVIEVERVGANWQLDFLLLPYLQGDHFANSATRIGVGLDGFNLLWSDGDSTDRSWALQGGIRYLVNLDSGDLHLHLLNYFDRTQFIVGTDKFRSIAGVAVPLGSLNNIYYSRIIEAALGRSYIINSLMFKIELAYKKFIKKRDFLTTAGMLSQEDHAVMASGIEWSGLEYGGKDIVWYVEWQRILGLDQATRSIQYVLQNDLFVGAKINFNDIAGSELKLYWLTDLERNNENFYGMSFSRRLLEHWKLNLGIKIFVAPQKGIQRQGLESFDHSDLASCNISYFF